MQEICIIPEHHVGIVQAKLRIVDGHFGVWPAYTPCKIPIKIDDGL
jgi:hypothetical protein